MDEEYGQQLDAYCDQPDCTSPEEQMQDNEWNEEMDNQTEGLNAEQNDEGQDDGKQNDDWNEEAGNGEMGKADEQGVESINNEQREESINDEQEDNINEDDFPLYPAASISFKVAMILLLAFITRHNLTNEAISDLFYIITLICPKPNRCCKSLYRFKKYLSFMITPTSFCYYCPTCFSLIDTTINMICNVASI